MHARQKWQLGEGRGPPFSTSQPNSNGNVDHAGVATDFATSHTSSFMFVSNQYALHFQRLLTFQYTTPSPFIYSCQEGLDSVRWLLRVLYQGCQRIRVTSATERRRSRKLDILASLMVHITAFRTPELWRRVKNMECDRVDRVSCMKTMRPS